MNIEVLEKIMRQNSLVVRAIPAKSIKILEAEHADMYPEGHLMHMPVSLLLNNSEIPQCGLNLAPKNTIIPWKK